MTTHNAAHNARIKCSDRDGNVQFLHYQMGWTCTLSAAKLFKGVTEAQAKEGIKELEQCQNPAEVLGAVRRYGSPDWTFELISNERPPLSIPHGDMETVAMIHDSMMWVLRNDNALRGAQTTWTQLSAGILKVALLTAEIIRPVVAAYDERGARFFTDEFLDLHQTSDFTLTAYLLNHLNDVDYYTIGEQWMEDGFELTLFIDGEEEDMWPAVGLYEIIARWLQTQPRLLEATGTVITKARCGLQIAVGANQS